MASSLRIEKVLVTGASGYIANHIIKQLLEGGRYAVRGTVRSLKNEKKVKPLQDLVPSPAIPLELVEADLLKEDTWPAAVEGCDYVLHVASPFPVGRKIRDEKAELIDPAVNGTKNVLKACADAKVKRVVLTSSIAAVSVGLVGAKNHKEGVPYTENDWSPEDELTLYEKSKMLAERAAWDFVKGLPEDKKFEFVVMNPGYVLGPLLSPDSGEGSKAAVGAMLKGEYPGVPAVNFPVVDVRDVAASHIKGLEVGDAVGHRFILVSHNVWMADMAHQLKAEFEGQGYKVKTGKLPKPIVWLSSLFDESAKKVYPSLNKVLTYNVEPMRSILGINPIPSEQTVIEMAYSLIELGVVPRKPQYHGPLKETEKKKLDETPEQDQSKHGDDEEQSTDNTKKVKE
jgi:nucleoside-diphosphate-sugar epimerase